MQMTALEQAYHIYNPAMEKEVVADSARWFLREALSALHDPHALTDEQRSAFALMAACAARLARARWAIEHGFDLNYNGAIAYIENHHRLRTLMAEFGGDAAFGVVASCASKTAPLLLARLETKGTA